MQKDHPLQSCTAPTLVRKSAKATTWYARPPRPKSVDELQQLQYGGTSKIVKLLTLLLGELVTGTRQVIQH